METQKLTGKGYCWYRITSSSAIIERDLSREQVVGPGCLASVSCGIVVKRYIDTESCSIITEMLYKRCVEER